MLEAVLNYLNNDFRAVKQPQPQEYTIQGGTLAIDGILNGQYVRIFDSVLNDGIYKYPLSDLQDETFYGYVVPLRIPKAVLELADEIKTWSAKNQPTAFTSESFGGYSYSKATTASGLPVSWQDVFKPRLAPYRKLKQH